MYIVLTGAKKNVGDFLIADRTKKLLQKEKPKQEIIEYNGWEPLTNKLQTVNKAKALIIAGGPGYHPNAYPKIYPLIHNLDEIKPPIIPMALGWMGYPGDQISLDTYKFSNATLNFIRKAHKLCTYSSCRDVLTERVLKKFGIQNALMTGCSTWYDHEHMHKEFKGIKEVKKIAFSTPQLSFFREQSLELLWKLKHAFPSAEIVSFFHRGIAEDQYTGHIDAENSKVIIKELNRMNIDYVDLAYNLSRMKMYDDFDLHVGYRLHGHLYFLSQRKPSYLINEDGRGIGMQTTLNLPIINGFVRTATSDILNGLGLNRSLIIQKTAKRYHWEMKNNPEAPDQCLKVITDAQKDDFKSFVEVFGYMKNNYSTMKKFLDSLPE